jgi:agmatinase
MSSNQLQFGDLDPGYTSNKQFRIVILPVPYDETSTWKKGADQGPDAILKASTQLELYDIETDTEVYLQGIHTANPILEKSSTKLMIEAVRAQATRFLEEGKFLVTIGGEHSVSIGAIQAYAKRFPKVTVLQIDAHADLRSTYHNSQYNHACVMSRVKEICPIVQVGIRSMDSEEKEAMDLTKVIFGDQIRSGKDWIGRIIEMIPGEVYITFDLDAFDPSIMPSTGTPEPGGLLWYETLDLLRELAAKRNVIGFDVVELCPRESNWAPDFLAAKLIYKLLSYCFLDTRQQ